MTLIFSFPPYFQGILASVDSTCVCCMSFSAACAGDAGFYKLCMAEKRPAIWVLWVSTESQASAAGRNWRWPFNFGRYGRRYPGVTVRAPYIYRHFDNWQQLLRKGPSWGKADVSPSLRTLEQRALPCTKWALSLLLKWVPAMSCNMINSAFIVHKHSSLYAYTYSP